MITLIKNLFNKEIKLDLKKVWIFLCVIAAVFILIQAVLVLGDVFGWQKDETLTVIIPENAVVSDIATILKEDEVIRYPLLFRVYEKLGGDKVFQQGGHILNKNQSYKEIIKKLTSAPDLTFDQTVSVLIPEGLEAWQIAKRLEDAGIVDSDAFLKELDEGEFDFEFIKDIKRKENRLEGYLFPATYEFFVGEGEHSAINRMLEAFEARVLPIYEQSGTKYSLDEIVTMASLVEREAANDNERGKVASVFYNRIDRDMTLGSCATVQYILKERKTILSNADTKIKSDYNTYINRGLPIGPIASPGEASVKAALYPEDTDYLYFAARMDGSENLFSKTHAEHLEKVRILQNGN